MAFHQDGEIDNFKLKGEFRPFIAHRLESLRSRFVVSHAFTIICFDWSLTPYMKRVIYMIPGDIKMGVSQRDTGRTSEEDHVKGVEMEMSLLYEVSGRQRIPDLKIAARLTQLEIRNRGLLR